MSCCLAIFCIPVTNNFNFHFTHWFSGLCLMPWFYSYLLHRISSWDPSKWEGFICTVKLIVKIVSTTLLLLASLVLHISCQCSVPRLLGLLKYDAACYVHIYWVFLHFLSILEVLFFSPWFSLYKIVVFYYASILKFYFSLFIYLDLKSISVKVIEACSQFENKSIIR